MNLNLCPHGQNHKTCLTCYRMPKPQQARAPEPIVEANRLGAPMKPLPGRGHVPVVGDRTGSQVGVAVCGAPQVSEAEKEKYRYPKGRPVQAGAPVQMRDPYTSNQGEQYDKDGLLTPPPVGMQLIDQLPPPPPAKT